MSQIEQDAAALQKVLETFEVFSHPKAPATHHALVNAINSVQTSWTAAENPRFQDLTMSDAAVLCGIKVEQGPVLKGGSNPMCKISPSFPGCDDYVTPKSPPTPGDSFDGRSAFPHCAQTIGMIRDQAQCGSCWAFASAEAYNDARCVYTNGAEGLVPFSALDTLECATAAHGCHGTSDLTAAYQLFKNVGVATGGNYGDYSTCKPYLWRHFEGPGENVRGPSCTKTCSSNRTDAISSYSQEVFSNRMDVNYKLIKTPSIEQIQSAVRAHGSVTTIMHVYSDLMSYDSGIYTQQSSQKIGAHAVRIVGWGFSSSCANGAGCNYWTVANSWGSSWGEKGFIRIKMGDSELGHQIVYADYPIPLRMI